MERLTIAVRNDVASVLLEKKKFTHDSLIELGFEFMGFCWGCNNKPYHELDSELGTICVVDYRTVYIIKGSREHQVRKISNVEQLKQFIDLLDLS